MRACCCSPGNCGSGSKSWRACRRSVSTCAHGAEANVFVTFQQQFRIFFCRDGAAGRPGSCITRLIGLAPYVFRTAFLSFAETELLDALGSCITTALRLYGVRRACCVCVSALFACFHGMSDSCARALAHHGHGTLCPPHSMARCSWLITTIARLCPSPRAQDAALPLVEGLMPAVSKLLEKGRFPGGFQRPFACSVEGLVSCHSASNLLDKGRAPDAAMIHCA